MRVYADRDRSVHFVVDSKQNELAISADTRQAIALRPEVFVCYSAVEIPAFIERSLFQLESRLKVIGVLFVVYFFAACGSAQSPVSAKQPVHKNTIVEQATTQETVTEALNLKQPVSAVFDPPPPNGIPLPRGVIIVRQDPQDPRSASTWAA